MQMIFWKDWDDFWIFTFLLCWFTAKDWNFAILIAWLNAAIMWLDELIVRDFFTMLTYFVLVGMFTVTMFSIVG